MEIQKISIPTLVNSLRSLSADNIHKYHKQFTDSHLADLSEEIDHTEVFTALKFNIKYLSYQLLLDFLIHEFALKDVKTELENYKSKIQEFRRTTPVTIFCQALQNQSQTECPANFQKVMFVFDDLERMMLENLEQFQVEFSHYYELKYYAMIFDGADVASSNVTWFVPESVVNGNILQAEVPIKNI